MTLELYFYNECGFCQSVLNCMSNLHCSDKVAMKNIRENSAYAEELVGLTGAENGAGSCDRRKAAARL
jgi:hypothetical protein